MDFLDGAAITKADVINYKECARKSRKAESVNNRLAAVNGFLKFVKKEDCRVKNLRVQKNLFAREEKELTRKEYQRLLEAAGDSKIGYIMQTIVATGIRISELQYITVDAVLAGETVVDNKNKIRHIYNYAFMGAAKITKVTIPKSVEKIATYAFSGNTALTTIVYGGTKAAWTACTALSENSILKSVTNIICSDGVLQGSDGSPTE